MEMRLLIIFQLIRPVERVSYLEKMIHNNGYDRYAYEGVKKHREIQERLKNSS